MDLRGVFQARIFPRENTHRLTEIFSELSGQESSTSDSSYAGWQDPTWAEAGRGNLPVSAPANPTQVLTYLLQPSVSRLAFDIVAVYITAATKVFGQWASQMAEGWRDGMLTEVKDMVEMVIERVTPFSTSPHIEVQERVCGYAFFLISPC